MLPFAICRRSDRHRRLRSVDYCPAAVAHGPPRRVGPRPGYIRTRWKVHAPHDSGISGWQLAGLERRSDTDGDRYCRAVVGGQLDGPFPSVGGRAVAMMDGEAPRPCDTLNVGWRLAASSRDARAARSPNHAAVSVAQDAAAFGSGGPESLDHRFSESAIVPVQSDEERVLGTPCQAFVGRRPPSGGDQRREPLRPGLGDRLDFRLQLQHAFGGGDGEILGLPSRHRASQRSRGPSGLPVDARAQDRAPPVRPPSSRCAPRGPRSTTIPGRSPRGRRSFGQRQPHRHDRPMRRQPASGATRRVPSRVKGRSPGVLI